MKMEAEAEGAQAILTKQAEGLRDVVSAAGGVASDAVSLMLADKMEQLLRIQVDAIKGVKFDKVTVWDSGSGDGKGGTAGFLNSMMKYVPPMSDAFASVGMELPGLLGRKKEEAAPEAPEAGEEGEEKA